MINCESICSVLGRQWYYQLCSEYGWFQTTDSPFQPFGNRIKLEYFVETCSRVFGDSFNQGRMQRNVDSMNVSNGGRNIVISNAFFTNGGMDPFRFLNVMNSRIANRVEAKTLPCKHNIHKYALPKLILYTFH